MKEIKLSLGKVAIVDDEDFEMLNRFKWHACKSKQTFYAERFEYGNGSRIRIKMHRLLTGAKKNELVDHKDHNGLNNQKSNLRVCDYSQNNANKAAYGVSKYRGVSLKIVTYRSKSGELKTYNYWKAEIFSDDKVRFLGYFKSEIEAARRYNEEAKKVHCEFANLNDV